MLRHPKAELSLEYIIILALTAAIVGGALLGVYHALSEALRNVNVQIGS